MALELTNTLTRRKELFEPRQPDRVGMYVCGPTVYDRAHIGNARPVVVFDLLYRLLRRRYAEVTYVRNITDVDDKIIAAAARTAEPIEALTRRTTQAFHADMDALGALRPDIEPRATEHIAAMVALIGQLIGSGHAYAAEGHVLFHVPAMPDYGALSRRNRDEMVAGARVEVAPYKRDPADFVLWKPSSPDQPGWNSPWGRGRPGWHIECSAMAREHLGVTFDIHGGGLDLIFPHHENEIAQSRCAHGGAPLARVWLHNGFVMVNGEKMAKSAGNFFTVRDLLEKGWDGEVIRLTLLSAHYRQPLDFTERGLSQALSLLNSWYGALRNAGGEAASAEPPPEVVAALEDDLNTPLAIAHLSELASALNKAPGATAKGALLAAGQVLGLFGQDPEAWFKSARGPGAASAGLGEAEIEALIDARIAARQAKNFAEADRVRGLLKDDGVVLEDHRDGRRTTWRRE
ncbi:MAG: cysteine--tRNA ligase [Azospirillum sp.]|nr:cysteine--tRNA ligase [Azospirillum sp.]